MPLAVVQFETRHANLYPVHLMLTVAQMGTVLSLLLSLPLGRHIELEKDDISILQRTMWTELELIG